MKIAINILIGTLLLVLSTSSEAQNLILDPGFEGGTPNGYWSESSSNFPNVICSLGSCGNCSGSCIPRSGSFFVWLGGATSPEMGTVSQTITFPNGPTVMKFWLLIPTAMGSSSDYVRIEIAGNVVFTANSGNASDYSNYTEVELDLTAYGDGNPHTITVRGVQNSSSITHFIIDDISVEAGTIGINDNYLNQHVTVYPNPASKHLNIDFFLDQSSAVSVELQTISGATVFQKQLQGVTTAREQLDVSQLSKGIYLLHLQSEEGNAVRKVVID